MDYDTTKYRKKVVTTCGHIWKLKLANGEIEDKFHVFHRCTRFRGHLSNHSCVCGSRPRKNASKD